MTAEAKVLELQPRSTEASARALRLPSGRRLQVTIEQGEERLEVVEASGAVSLRVRLTEQGPVLLLEGVRLELKGAESIALAAPRIDIAAADSASLRSGGDLQLASSGETGIRAEQDVRVTGRLIHLN